MQRKLAGGALLVFIVLSAAACGAVEDEVRQRADEEINRQQQRVEERVNQEINERSTQIEDRVEEEVTGLLEEER
ncbi:hypothetical protein [Rubrobacter indicoceani]|uniref:hypothetical protein n=1 Tax=Rubrobacter indicoceani TaxID=2051957 RepID=UPI000E5A1713|nr:hypothetical protein [Rubrobacter indicoceani]